MSADRKSHIADWAWLCLWHMHPLPKWQFPLWTKDLWVPWWVSVKTKKDVRAWTLMQAEQHQRKEHQSWSSSHCLLTVFSACFFEWNSKLCDDEPGGKKSTSNTMDKLCKRRQNNSNYPAGKTKRRSSHKATSIGTQMHMQLKWIQMQCYCWLGLWKGRRPTWHWCHWFSHFPWILVFLSLVQTCQCPFWWHKPEWNCQQITFHIFKWECFNKNKSDDRVQQRCWLND